MGLKEAKAYLEKKKILDESNVFRPNEMLGVTPTSSVVLDMIIGIGGFPKGRITEIYGREGTGKSTLAMGACREVVKQGGSAVYIDHENTFYNTYSQDMGLKIDNETFMVVQPRTLEEGQTIAMQMAREGVNLIVFDSIAAMTPQKILDAEPHENTVGLHARSIGKMLTQLIPTIRESNTAVLMLNQLRDRIKIDRFDRGPDEQTTGGRALPYYMSLRIELSTSTLYKAVSINPATGKEAEMPYAADLLAKITKNRFSPPHRSGKMHLVYGKGIDNVRTIVDLSIANNVITQKGGGNYSFDYRGELFKCRGEDKLLAAVRENPDMLNMLITTTLGSSAYGVSGERPAVIISEKDLDASSLYSDVDDL